ncbi:hypothetical protein GPUN_2510 [Glaciecola punicea ACAM 611]|jgi:hypothetical protein|uniref:Uncharacterized protein n=1 Tax=Glaciecola punicea ACAM 611 TaxID=1121923 RepID=H5TE98_9ALTE|nr:hypothetical protein GPUN_2510 [Glaciecola punicea ACAM 611]
MREINHGRLGKDIEVSETLTLLATITDWDSNIKIARVLSEKV